MATCVWAGTTNGNFGTSGNYLGAAAPANGDTVFVQGSVSIDAGLTTGLTAVNLVIDPTYTGTIGTSTSYLSIGCASFNFAGRNTSYIDLGSSAITAIVTDTIGATTNTAGLYLKGSALTALAVSGGSVALAGLDGETSTVTTARVSGSNSQLILGTGVTATTVSCSDANLYINAEAATIATVTINSGTCTLRGSVVITTVTQNGGTFYPSSSAATPIVTHNINGGTANYLVYPKARTVTNLKLNPGGILVHDPAILTITNKTNPDYPIRVTATTP